MKKIGFYTLWAIVAFLAFNLVLIAIQYFNFDTNYKFLKHKQAFVHNKLWLASFYIHLAFGIVCVLTGLPLFFSWLVKFKSRLHKSIGKIYVGSILFLTGPTGFYLAFYAEGGFWSSVGFVIMSLAWMLITYKALERIKNKDIEGHYRWMIRSYCFTLSGITLRIMTPLGIQVFGIEQETNFILTAYLPWIFNILLGELIIYLNRKQISNYSSLIR